MIDDDADVVDMTVLTLQFAGHQATGTTDGQRGIEVVLSQRPDVLILDYMMPAASGAEVGRRLRSDRHVDGLKIVMVSGTPEAVVRADFDSYDVFLVKPVTGERLLQTIIALTT